MSNILQLFLSFCKIGYTSFGGLSMIPLINNEMVTHGWMTATEVTDIVAIAEMTPGPLGLNCATFAGIRVAGVLGALAANFGMLMPTMTLCVLAALFFERFKSSKILGHIMMGVRPACIGLVWGVMLNLSRINYFSGTNPQWICIAIAALGTYLLIGRKWSIPSVIVLGAVIGVFVC